MGLIETKSQTGKHIYILFFLNEYSISEFSDIPPYPNRWLYMAAPAKLGLRPREALPCSREDGYNGHLKICFFEVDIALYSIHLLVGIICLVI